MNVIGELMLHDATPNEEHYMWSLTLVEHFYLT